MIKKIFFGKDTGSKKLFKLQLDSLSKNFKFFNSSDVLVGNPMSNIAVAFVYNWKADQPPKEIRDFFIRVSSYSFLTGYWRTTNGAKYVFSNLLLNPNVNKLVICVFGAKDNGHNLVDTLRCFWKNGISKDGTIIASKAANPRFEGLPAEALERIKKQIDLIIIENADETKIEETITACYQEPGNKRFVSGIEIIPIKALYDDGARFEKPLLTEIGHTSSNDIEYVPESEIISTLGLSITAENLDDALKKIVRQVFEKGSVLKDQRKITIREERSLSVVIKDPLAKLPEHYSDEYLNKYKKEFMNGSKEKGEFVYTYHERIFNRWGNQPERIISLLKSSPNTRRALISLWDPESDLGSQTPPCLDFLWFCVRSNKLECHVVYRSHHLATVDSKGNLIHGEGAFVPNIYAIAHLHKMIAKKAGFTTGPIILTDFSGHLYVCD
jgi:thymidylate synthase (methanogen type)